MSKYIVVIRRNGQSEEYDGGNTIAEARKEAAFFVVHTPSTVKICTVDKKTSRLLLTEVVRFATVEGLS